MRTRIMYRPSTDVHIKKSVYGILVPDAGERLFIAKFGGIVEEELTGDDDRVIARKLKMLVSMWDN